MLVIPQMAPSSDVKSLTRGHVTYLYLSWAAVARLRGGVGNVPTDPAGAEKRPRQLFGGGHAFGQEGVEPNVSWDELIPAFTNAWSVQARCRGLGYGVGSRFNCFPSER